MPESPISPIVSQRLGKYISDPVVTVSVQEIKGNKIYVIGQVNKPGEFVVNPSVDVMQALPFKYDDVVRGSTRRAATSRSCPGRHVALNNRTRMEVGVGNTAERVGGPPTAPAAAPPRSTYNRYYVKL